MFSDSGSEVSFSFETTSENSIGEYTAWTTTFMKKVLFLLLHLGLYFINENLGSKTTMVFKITKETKFQASYLEKKGKTIFTSTLLTFFSQGVQTNSASLFAPP